MKPTIIRNKTIFQASLAVRSRQLCSHLSKDLQNKYNKRNIRVTEGDTVKVLRGEYKGVTGKITRVSSEKNGVAIEGIKKEKLKGGNVDVFIHPSNLIVTELNTEDKWRQNKLGGKSPKSTKEIKPKEEKPKETKPKEEAKPEPKQEKPKTESKPKEKQEKPKETKSKPKQAKESKTAKKAKKEYKK